MKRVRFNEVRLNNEEEAGYTNTAERCANDGSNLMYLVLR
jgi:hypothetical protein